MNRWEQEAAEQEAAEQRAYEAQMQAMYDEQQREQQTTEQVTWLQKDVERLKAENEVLRQERPAVVAWLRTTAEADKDTAKSYMHAEGVAYWRGVIGALEDMADAIERGEHRKEDT